MTSYYLITGASEAQVEKELGLRGRMTPLGVLVEKPKEFDLPKAMAKIEKALNPNRCTCGTWSVLHQPNCPTWGVMT